MCRKDDAMLQSLAQLISYPSVATTNDSSYPFGKGVYDALQYSLDLCQSLGFRIKNCNDLLGYAEAGQGDRLIGVLVHLDVVPAGSGWDTDPFSAYIVKERIYGRGAMDDKGPAIAAIYAVKDLLEKGALKDKRIRIIFGCSEESGQWSDIEYYKQNEEIPECGFTPDAEFPLIYAEKGIANVMFSMEIKSSGIKEILAGEASNMVPAECRVVLADGEVIETEGKSAHGSTPEEGINAINLAMKDVKELTAECPFADFYLSLFSDHNGKSINCHLADTASGEITFNPGKVFVKKSKIILVVDIRYPVTFTCEEVMRRIAEASKRWGVQLELLTNEAPMYVEKDDPLCISLLSAYQEVTGDMSEPIAMGGGTYAKAMNHILAFGPVFPGRECTEHQANEYILIDDLYKARKIYALALSRL